MSRYMKIAKLPDKVFHGIVERVCAPVNSLPMYRLCQGGSTYLGDILHEEEGIACLERYLEVYKKNPKQAIHWLSVSYHLFKN